MSSLSLLPCWGVVAYIHSNLTLLSVLDDMGVTVTMDNVWLQWALMTLIDPKKTVANLIYIGYRGDPTSALHLTRRRKADRKKQKTERNVFNCFVFGPKSAGKSAIINSFIDRYCSPT